MTDIWPSFPILERESRWQEERPTVKTKMPENADYCCGDPKSGIKLPATLHINGIKSQRRDEEL